MALVTLDAMAAGGIYDHLVGGFCRYSTDGRWLVPHFEKMLTDQALLARTYLHAWQVTGDDRYQQVLTETLDYVLDALRTPDGALFSSEDADAAGVEGGHATFTKAHIQEILGAAGRSDLIDVTCAWYGITEAGNWEGTNVLHRPVGAPLARSDDIEAARLLLLEHRRSRPQPALDDKVLTEWNAMAITALAEAACATGNARWGQGAEEIAEFLFAQLRQPNGRWLRSWQGGRARHLALAADYAWVVQACIAVAAWSGKAIWSTRAGEVADQMLELFWDNEAGGLFTTGNDAEALIVRPKEFVDGAVPSTNSIGADALFRVGALRADERFADAARAIVGLGQPLLARHASALADLVSSIQLAEAGAEMVVTGDRPDLVDEVRRHWLPAAVVAFGQAEDTDLWRDRAPDLAYVCHHFTCQAPTDQTGHAAPAAEPTSWCPSARPNVRRRSGRMRDVDPFGPDDYDGTTRQEHNPATAWDQADGSDQNSNDEEVGQVPSADDTQPPTSERSTRLSDDGLSGSKGSSRTSRRERRDRRPAGQPRGGTARKLMKEMPRRERVLVTGGATLHLLVLASTAEDTIGVDLASGAVLRLRVPWPEGHEPDLAAFDVVEATLADDPERDDLAQPEATTGVGLPRHVGTLRGRKVRHLLEALCAPPDGPLLGFPGPSAPYWEFRGFRPSVALIEPSRGPQLIRRKEDGSTWSRFGWERDDVWLPVEDRHAARSLDAARRDRLSGKDLATALGFRPQYLLATVSQPRDGHCYKVCSALLPRG